VCTSGPLVRPAMNRWSIEQRRMNAVCVRRSWGWCIVAETVSCGTEARFSGRRPIARGIHPRAGVRAIICFFVLHRIE